MTIPAKKGKKIFRRQTVFFLWMLAGGLLLLPAAVYLVGKSVFGEYGGSGFTEFYGTVHSELLSGNLSVWFLVLSPYLIWQLMRFTIRAFRASGRS